MTNKKHKNTCRNSNYFKNFLLFISAVAFCVSVSTFASLVGNAVGITSHAVELKICALTARIKKYKSIIIKKRKKNNKIVLLGKGRYF